MILLVQDMLKDAMGLIGATEIDETPSSSEMLTALRIANIMLDRWSSQQLLLRSTSTLTIPITSGKASYTIGNLGGDITSKKPISLISGFIRDSAGIDSEVKVLTNQQYDDLSIKTISSSPEYVIYNPGESQQIQHLGTITLYPVPNQDCTLICKVYVNLNEFTNLTDEVMFEPMYYEALIYNLAARLFRRYHASGEIPADIVAIASNAIQNIKQTNSTRIIAKSDFSCNSKYNVYTDGY